MKEALWPLLLLDGIWVKEIIAILRNDITVILPHEN